jgi:hypothetical protein
MGSMAFDAHVGPVTIDNHGDLGIMLASREDPV